MNDPGGQQRQSPSARRPPAPITSLPNNQGITYEKPLPTLPLKQMRSPPPTHHAPEPPCLNKSLPALPRRSAAEARDIRHDAPMNPPTVSRVVTWLGENLAHIPYAVTGVACLIMHGFGGRLPTHVSVLCPEHCKNVMRSWAAARGVVLYPTEKEFGVLLAGEKSHVRRVRMKFVSEEGFAGIETVYMRKGRVLSLTTLVDVLAEEFMEMTGDRTGEGRLLLGGGIIWAAERLVEMGPEGLD
ncbi:uncharacterized protein DNG_05048 [Cephalotrichum gorgonifer]|uniref:Uncharacterized protein n=1 Tax=Cephalotrichum gorgonifer TaxID=2041049 RepID=A0AAE8MXS2_9PEZI|nr:uncharacterized protein DNG_05048 [Cephalotrichum gorgonifer]